MLATIKVGQERGEESSFRKWTEIFIGNILVSYFGFSDF